MLHFLVAFTNPESEKYLRNTAEITTKEFYKNFEKIDDLVYASWQEIISDHEKAILSIKQGATKHQVSFDQGDDPEGLDPELYDF